LAAYLEQSTAVDIALGPFLDETDGKTAETGLTITQPDIRLKKNGGNWAQKNASQTLSHEENGWYEVALDTTDTNTLGILIVAVHEAGALPVWREFMVLPANVYDALVGGSDLLQVDVQELEGDNQSSLDLKDFADAGYDPATNKVEGVKLADALTANNDKTGYRLSASGVDDIWDEDVDAAHQTAGTAGKKLDDAGGAADPWSTALPGSYTQGSAGHIVGHLRQRAGTAQAGAAGSITLDAGASSSDDFYNNAIVQIVAGAGAGQSRIISDYTGATRVASVNGNWVVNPDNTSSFAIYPFGSIPGASAPTAAQVADAVWDEAVADHQTAGSTGKVLSTRVTGGAGGLQRTIGVTVGGNPLEGASIWVATDSAGTNVVAGPLVTSSQGSVTVLLDTGSYYVWVQKDGYNAILAQPVTVS
jgi:hypothetical protein